MNNKDIIGTYLGGDTEIEGNLKFYGTIRIDGPFKGEILGQGTLIVGEGAALKSDIHVSCVFISGEIRGDVTADEKIEIYAPGKVFGNIQAPSVVINEGAIIDGNCATNQAKEPDERRLTVVSSDKSAVHL
ncbi:MAG: polymer-forming cytoskeletal protein [Desulfobacteraceae bacterium]